MIDKLEFIEMLKEATYEIEHRDVGKDNNVIFTMQKILPMSDKQANKLLTLSINYEEKEGGRYCIKQVLGEYK